MTTTTWDYSTLADAYLKRPDYADAVIDRMLATAGVEAGASVCDVGAGVAHLTIKLAERGCRVTAVEPNEAMASHGRRRTAPFPDVRWAEGTGEHTGQPGAAFDLVTFGSSFNVTDRPRALVESARILRPRGWFACLWNHRDLDDPVQAAIENLIRERISDYRHGVRREDQTEIIRSAGLFGEVLRFEGRVQHAQSPDDCITAWRSHATLQRQAGERFSGVIAAIERYVRGLGCPTLLIPYTTRLWMAPLTK